MKMYLGALYVAIALLLCISSAMAQTVTVDAANGSPNNTDTFNSIQMAIHSFQASGAVAASTDGSGVGVNHGNAAADVINILTSAVPDEYITADADGATGDDNIVLDEDLTIQGSGGVATVALQQSGLGVGTNDGFYWSQDVDLTINDIIFLPSVTNTPADDALYFRSTTNAQDTVVNVDHVWVTADIGSYTPATTTGLDNPDISAATKYGDDGIYVVSRTEGGSITFNATYLVVSSWNDNTDSGRDALLVFMSGDTNDIVNAIANLGEGCVFSNAMRFGIQNPYGGYVNIQGTHDNPVIINNCVADGIWCYSDASGATQATVTEVNYCIFNNIGSTAIKEQETNNRGFIKSVSNTLISNTEGPGIALFAAGALPPSGGVTDTVQISNVTLHNCGYNDANDPPWNFAIGSPIYNSTNKSNRNVVITDTIITGFGLTGLYNDSDGTYSIDYSCLCTENLGGYAYALGTTTAGASTITVGANVINDNPIYVKFAPSEFADPSYLDVDNPAFAGKASGGADLAGGADFIGSWTPPLSAGSSWRLYQ